MGEMPPFKLDTASVQTVEPVLRALVQAMIDWKPDA
jgi:hypothetical protein